MLLSRSFAVLGCIVRMRHLLHRLWVAAQAFGPRGESPVDDRSIRSSLYRFGRHALRNNIEHLCVTHAATILGGRQKFMPGGKKIFWGGTIFSERLKKNGRAPRHAGQAPTSLTAAGLVPRVHERV